MIKSLRRKTKVLDDKIFEEERDVLKQSLGGTRS